MIVTSYYTAFCLEKYCGRKSTVIHPVIINIPDEIQNSQRKEVDFDNQINYQRPIVLFSHGRLEPGKGFDTIVKIWKELQATENKEIKLIIAGE